VTADDNGGTVRIKRGGILIIRLEAQAGAGLSWQVAKSDPARLAPLGEPMFQTRRGQGGRLEMQVIRFKAQAPGQSEIELHYQRPLETEKRPRIFRITVEIA
jgi:predicted secreted protein